MIGVVLVFDLVPVSSTAAESASVAAAEAFASVAIAGLAVKPAESSVVALSGLERKLGDSGAAFGALESQA